MKITVTLNTYNDAMQQPGEVSRIFNQIADLTFHIEALNLGTMKILDVNGNTVGTLNVQN